MNEIADSRRSAGETVPRNGGRPPRAELSRIRASFFAVIKEQKTAALVDETSAGRT